LKVKTAWLVSVAIAGLVSSWPAFGQDFQDRPPEPTQDAAETPPMPSADEISFSAGQLNYDFEREVVSASGNVFLAREGYRLRADEIVWNRATGEVIASGNVAVTNPEGDTAYGDRITLTDTLRDGIVENLLVVFEQGGRLAAARGERLANGDLSLDRAIYTGCPVETPKGCPKRPSWVIKAARVEYDASEKRLRYRGARLELFGLPLIPLPLLAHNIGGEGGPGFLVPEIGLDRVNGLELAFPYYFRFAPNRDLTIIPHVYSDAIPMLEAQYRALNRLGAYQVRGFATYGERVPVGSDAAGGVTQAPRNDFRGYVESSGRFQLTPRWSISESLRYTTDRTFLRRYDISRDDRLRSTINVERIDPTSYLGIVGWAAQTLRTGDIQGQQPVALPLIDFRKRIEDPLLGGTVQFQANTLGITRDEGQDTQRAFASAQWNWRGLTTLGQEVSLTGLVRGDLYHSDENLLTPVVRYRGQEGWQARGIATAAVDIKWPFVGPLAGGIQRLVPRIQIVATPAVENFDIPNEDSRAFDLEDINIFSLNRFPGYDRYEGNARITYGLDWTLDRPGFAIAATAGQSYRLDDAPVLFPDGTGLTDRFSDYVGRVTAAYRDFARVTARFRLDKDSFQIRRNEIDLTVGSRKTYATLGYLRLDRDIDLLEEDLRDTEEIRAGARVAFARYWSVFGSAIVDLTGREEDPLALSDGFTPVRHRLGLLYEDECLSLGLTWRRDYDDTGDAERGNSFLLRLAFRNLGV